MFPIPVNPKLVAAAAAVVGLGFLIYTGASKAYRAGYDAAKVEMYALAAEEAERAVAAARKQWQRSSEAAKKQLVTEDRINEKAYETDKQISAAVSTVPPECRDVGDAVLGVFNQAVSPPLLGGGADSPESESKVSRLPPR